MGESSPPPKDPSRPGTEGGTEAGEEDIEMAEHSSFGELFATPLAQSLTSRYITPASPETHTSPERSQERCIYAWSFRCGCCVLWTYHETKAVE